MDLFDLEEAWQWRRSREWELLVCALRLVKTDMDTSEILRALPGYVDG